MSENINLETVQETMLISLWGRAKFSRLYPELLDDPEAVKIIEKVEGLWDFAGRTLVPHHIWVFRRAKTQMLGHHSLKFMITLRSPKEPKLIMTFLASSRGLMNMAASPTGNKGAPYLLNRLG